MYNKKIKRMLLLVLVSFSFSIFFQSLLFTNQAYATSGVTFKVDLNIQGKTMENKFAKLGCWNYKDQWLDKADAKPNDFMTTKYPFVKDVQLLMAAGGSYVNTVESISYDDVDGMTSVTVTALFAHTSEVIDDFKFLVYTDAGGWQQMYQWSKTDTLINSNSWTKRVYSITSIPSGAKWFSIHFPSGGKDYWNPQLSKVEIACTNPITDDLNDWSKIWWHSDGLALDTVNGTALGDASRLRRTDTIEEVYPERITYNYSGITAVEITGFFAHSEEAIDDFKFYTSTNGSSWTQYTSWTNLDALINSNTWTKRVYTLSSIPTGTAYFKIEYPVGGKYSWNPQLGKVVITAATTVTDDLNDWTKISSRTSGLTINTQNPSALQDSSRACRDNNYDGYPGCNSGRDMFIEPQNRNVLDDYDFSKLLTACQNIVDKGLKPRIKTGNVPIKYSSNPLIDVYGVNVRPPDNYTTYYNYIKAMADALKNQFGVSEVATWSFGVYNEYENEDIFLAGDGTVETTKTEFFKIYDYTVAALEDSLGASNVNVGAHAMASAVGKWDARDLIDHCATGTNYKTGGTGAQIDYISVSYYGYRPGDPGDMEASTYMYALSSTLDEMRERAISKGLTNLKFGVDEGGILYGPETGEKVLTGRLFGHSYGGSETALLFKEQTDIDLNWFSLWSLNSEGVWGGVPGVWTNIANLAYKMAGDVRVDVNKRGEPVNSTNMVDAIASFDSAGNKVHIMTYNHNKSINSTTSESPVIKIDNIAPVTGNTVTVKKWIVDDTHANYWSTWWQDRTSQGYNSDSYWFTEYYSIYSQEVPTIATKQSVKDYWYSRESTYNSLSQLSYETSDVTVVNNSITLTPTIEHHGVVFYEITNAKKSTTILPTGSIIDHLNDWSFVNSKSSGLILDTANGSYVEDSSRACRNNTNTSPEEYVTYYRAAGVEGIQASGIFAYQLESVNNFKFYTSPDGSTWTLQAGWTYKDKVINNDFARRDYRLDSVPSGTKYIKIGFPTGGLYSWNPQLSKVKIITKQITDNMDNWYVLNSHSKNLKIDTVNASALEDTSRICRTDTSTTESIYYYALQMKSVAATALFATQHESINNLKFYTSPDRITWTEQTTWSCTDELINSNTWTRRTYILDSLPSNTNYLKIVFPTGGLYSWNPQLGKVEIVN